MPEPTFEWNDAKNRANQKKHGVSFEMAQRAFLDPRALIAEDTRHSEAEPRFYCFGDVDGAILTVRFTWRDEIIRIFGAGYWHKGKDAYEEANG